MNMNSLRKMKKDYNRLLINMINNQKMMKTLNKNKFNKGLKIHLTQKDN